jgi:hypothetical protein
VAVVAGLGRAAADEADVEGAGPAGPATQPHHRAIGAQRIEVADLEAANIVALEDLFVGEADAIDRRRLRIEERLLRLRGCGGQEDGQRGERQGLRHPPS